MILKPWNSCGNAVINVAIPNTEATATVATPNSSPYIIQNVFLTPMVIPKLMAKVIHMPGVMLTIKNVGIKILSKVKSIKVLVPKMVSKRIITQLSEGLIT